MKRLINKKQQLGVTLIELTIAIAIIAITVFAILSVFKVSVSYSADPLVNKQAILVSETLLEEILSKPFNKPSDGFAGPYTSSNRQNFDAVSDYNGLTINGITTITGIAIPNLEKYNIKVNMENKALGSISSSNALLVTITVTGPNNNFILKGYKINDE